MLSINVSQRQTSSDRKGVLWPHKPGSKRRSLSFYYETQSNLSTVAEGNRIQNRELKVSLAEPAGKREKKLKISMAKASRVAGDPHRRYKNT